MNKYSVLLINAKEDVFEANGFNVDAESNNISFYNELGQVIAVLMGGYWVSIRPYDEEKAVKDQASADVFQLIKGDN